MEGGTALSAYRDGIIFEWEHDIDLAIWYNDINKLLSAVDQCIIDGCKIRIQKGFPFIDNIIQIYLPETITGPNPQINQVDIYIYRSKGEFAYMRWFNSPSGLFSQILKKQIFRLKRVIFPPENAKGKIKYLNAMIPKNIRYIFFKLFFYIYYKYGKSIYHVQPLEFFQNLKTIQFYGIPYKIPHDTENFLAHRYGPNWKTPDSNFNTDFYKEKWKKVSAREEFRFSFLDMPEIDFELQLKYIEHLPNHMGGTP